MKNTKDEVMSHTRIYKCESKGKCRPKRNGKLRMQGWKGVGYVIMEGLLFSDYEPVIEYAGNRWCKMMLDSINGEE